MYPQLFLEVLVGFFIFHHVLFEVSPAVIEMPVLFLPLWGCINILFHKMQQLDPKIIILKEKVG